MYIHTAASKEMFALQKHNHTPAVGNVNLVPSKSFPLLIFFHSYLFLVFVSYSNNCQFMENIEVKVGYWQCSLQFLLLLTIPCFQLIGSWEMDKCCVRQIKFPFVCGVFPFRLLSERLCSQSESSTFLISFQPR